jgi:YVTN family beta-propeller protein
VITFRVLGPLEVFDEQRPVALGGPKPRAFLAVLLVHRGEAVSTDRLIDALWGEQAPATAAKIVQGYVSHLRKGLGDGLLLTRGHGYLLDTTAGQVDLEQFDALVAEGRRALEAGDARVAAGRLRDALALWRGPPLADFAYEPFAHAEIARLEEARLAALEDRIDADLALGEHAALVSELDSLVRQHPLRERLQAQLMLALYRCGRQADALERYQHARRELVELGIEPGRALRELERAILAQDPALDAPPTRHTTHAARSRRGGLLLAVGGALLLAAAVAAATVALTRGGGGGGVTAAANSVAVIDPKANRVVSQIPVGVAPGSIAAGLGGIWVANTDDHSVSHIAPASRRVVGTLGFGDTVDGVAADAGALWMVDSTRGRASRIDPALSTPVRWVGVGDRAGVSSSPNAIAVGDGAAWVANNASAVVRIGPGAHHSRIDVGNDPSGIAIGQGATWVADDSDGTVSRIDSTGAVTASIPVGPGASGIASGAGAVWVVDTLADRLVRIDPTTDSATMTIGVGRRPRGVAVGAGAVWVANSGDGTISRVDPRANRVSATIPIGQSPQAVVVSRDAVWVSVAARPATPASSSAGPPRVLRVVREVPFASTDPALSGNTVDLQALQLYYATCAGLLTYPDRPAPEGTRLVPDVAKGMPSVSADGRTYTFIVRRGFRFSPPSNTPVTAATFKHTIERVLGPRLKAYSAGFMGDIVGMHAFRAGKAKHLAGVSASGDRLRIRLVAPSPDLRARIATPAFCASPDETPPTARPRPIPSAGPYYVASSSRDQVVLARNPNYRGHRPRIPKEVVYSFGVSLPRALHQVAAGRSDDVNAAVFVTSSESVLARLNALEHQYGPASAAARTGHQRYFVNPWSDVEYFALNTTRRLFASARMRRAVNYAIDRRALVQHHFLFNGGLATDHYLVPGIPGSRPLDIYPLGGPNLAEARRLAGRVHAHATMYTCTGAQCIEDARIVQADLAKIGITVHITALPDAARLSRLAKAGDPWDIGWSNWLADFPDPFTMINELFDPAFGFNFGRFDNPDLIARMRHAARLSGERRLQAYRRLDQDLTRSNAPVVAWGIGTVREFYSARVGCQIWQPIYGFDLGSVCLRR